MPSSPSILRDIQLSYLLYNIDEVKYSFMMSLLFQQKHTLEECLFWGFEMYKSNYEEVLWNFITKLYYDFYYVKNTSFEKKIDKEFNSWKHSNSFQPIAKIIKELHKQTIDTTIFNYYNLYNNTSVNPTSSKLSTVSISNTSKQKLLEMVKVDLLETTQTLKNNNVNYIKELYQKLYRYNEKKNVCLFYDNLHHKWFVKLVAKCIKTKKVWIKTKLTDQNEIQLCLYREKSKYIYKTLADKRHYSINTHIGCFDLARFKDDTDLAFIWNSSFNKYIPDDVAAYKSAYLYYWEYYANKTPFWNKIFKEYDVKFVKKEPNFPNDDMLEKFYDVYGFEPDEQSTETQQKSIKSINSTSIVDCFNRYGVSIDIDPSHLLHAQLAY
jgi:hypothetical protein